MFITELRYKNAVLHKQFISSMNVLNERVWSSGGVSDRKIVSPFY